MSDKCAARATDVVLAYGPRRALAASSFEIPAGAVTAIIGPNGSGKTTVLHALAGLIEPESGTVEVLGTSPAAARSRVSYVLQSVAVDEARAADHVLLVSGRVVSSGNPGEVLTRGNLEIAYGLGALHETTDGFLDDPHHSWGRGDQEDGSPGNHDSSPGD